MPVRILFVCLGNICRSPAAEAVMRHLVAEAGLGERIEVDSAGTGDWHIGELADARMRRAGKARGYELLGRARQVLPENDFSAFDYIVTMDNENMRAMQRLAGDSSHRSKISPLCQFASRHSMTEVPDPYYGGPEGFEVVLDLLEDACAGLLHHIAEKIPPPK